MTDKPSEQDQTSDAKPRDPHGGGTPSVRSHAESNPPEQDPAVEECFACHGRGRFEPDADEPMTTPDLICGECGGTGYRSTAEQDPAVEAAPVQAIVDEAHRADLGGQHREGFCRACADAYLVAQVAVEHLTDPALGDDAYVRLGAVVELLRSNHPAWLMRHKGPSAVVERLLREHHEGRL